MKLGSFAYPLLLMCASLVLNAQTWRAEVTPDWSAQTGTLRAVPTYQIVASPLMLSGSPIQKRVYNNVANLGADYARFQAWYPFPRMAVAELEPPAGGHTHWDFAAMDAVVVPFLRATAGHPVIMNIATIPEWMFKTSEPVVVPPGVDRMVDNYEQGTTFAVTLSTVADYFARVASWYTKGGFKDEDGVWHHSGYHFKIAYWEIGNEVDFEHAMTPQTYTAVYDAVVVAVRRVDPQMKFIGLAVAATSQVPWQKRNPEYFEYFLNHKNHKPGIPIDGISFHFYAVWAPGTPFDVYKHTVFPQADTFLSVARYVDSIRERLSPQTRCFIDELGFISGDDGRQGDPKHESAPLPDQYWNLAAAYYVYMFNNLSKLPGVESVGMSSGLGYPDHYYPSVTMMDWRTGDPNARYWALKLLIDHMRPGSKEVSTSVTLHPPNSPITADVQAQAFVTKDGRHEILIFNRSSKPFEVVIAGANGGTINYVDQSTGFHPYGTKVLVDKWIDPSSGEQPHNRVKDRFVLQGFEVAVVTLQSPSNTAQAK